MRNYTAMQEYVDLRRARPDVRAIDAWAFVNRDGDEGHKSLKEFLCRHEWVISEETDRCYCCYCGTDGDA